MRFCQYCEEPMYTSFHSEWHKKKNYDVHSKCSENWKLWVRHGGLKRLQKGGSEVREGKD